MSAMKKTVDNYVAFRLKRLSASPENASRASLARLRRGVGRKPGAEPELWGEFLADMPEELYSQNGDPSPAEWAVYTALTLYALHQQGRDIKTESMNQPGIGIGKAAAAIAKDEEDRERVWKRFCQIVSASDMTEMSQYLRGLVQLLKANGIALDYPKLAGDLFIYQWDADSVRLQWGQDFFRRATPSETGESTGGT